MRIFFQECMNFGYTLKRLCGQIGILVYVCLKCILFGGGWVGWKLSTHDDTCVCNLCYLAWRNGISKTDFNWWYLLEPYWEQEPSRFFCGGVKGHQRIAEFIIAFGVGQRLNAWMMDHIKSKNLNVFVKVNGFLSSADVKQRTFCAQYIKTAWRLGLISCVVWLSTTTWKRTLFWQRSCWGQQKSSCNPC